MGDERRHNATLAGLIGIALFAASVPEIAAQHMRERQVLPATPVSEKAVDKVAVRLAMPGVITLASKALNESNSVALSGSIKDFEESALTSAVSAYYDGKTDEARTSALAVARQLEETQNPALSDIRSQALLLVANIEMQDGEFEEAKRHLDMVPRNTPVDDMLAYMKGGVRTELGEHADAATWFEVAFKADTQVKHRARARHAHALYAAERWEEAHKALDSLVKTFPDYPRRPRALYERAKSLTKLERHQEAADAFQDAWFDYPFHPKGKAARLELELYAQDGIKPSKEISAEARLDRFRTMRINKHWDDVRELLAALLTEVATETGDSSLEHRIILQMAMNDYGQRHFEDAERHFLTLAQRWENGQREGINRGFIYRFLSRTYSAMGDLDKALSALDKEHEYSSVRTRLSARAQLLENHARYQEAFEIYDRLASASQKRGWDFTWLLYKTGQYDQAYENLSNLAERSSGERQAKYLYWAARTLENAGRFNEAKEVFAQVRDDHRTRYYGLQAANRILDIDQRLSVDGALIAKTEDIANAADIALDALETAEANVALASNVRDPRTLLRGYAETTPTEEVCVECEVEAPIPENALEVLNMAVSPLSQISNVLGIGADLPERDTDSDGSGGDTRSEKPLPKARLKHNSPVKADYTTSARIYWDGRMSSSASFARARGGQIPGPMPTRALAYDETTHLDGISRAAREAGHLFPELVRADWLWNAGLDSAARWSVRDVAIEFRELSRKYRPSRAPHELNNRRWSYYIDNRRRDQAEFWGMNSDELRFPVPSNAAKKQELLQRQQKIYDQRTALKPVLMDAFKEAGDHFMVRRYTLGTGGWWRRDPTGPERDSWMQAYSRAFPNLVLKEAKKYGMNPYVLWALMTVESSYNPDSISPALALGLLQVIPKTGLKTALMLGDDDFGPMDLLDEDVAIRHGAFYFSQLLKKFHGQELLAFAGYNGGPHRVGDWLDSRGNQPLDEFVEEIPFTEARGYAKKVARFIALYLRIYEGGSELYIGQNVRSDYRPEPRF